MKQFNPGKVIQRILKESGLDHYDKPSADRVYQRTKLFRKRMKQRSWINLNQRDHIRAVEKGFKRIALSGEKIKTILPYLLVEEEDNIHNYDFLYYRPETYQIALEAKKILDTKDFKSEYYHRKLGELFDYSNDDINNFIKNYKIKGIITRK